MQNNVTSRSWRFKAAAIVVLAAPALLGIGSATAASATTATTATPISASDNASIESTVRVSPPTSLPTERQPNTPVPSKAPGETRISIGSIVNLIKSLPGWWSKFSAGVKKAYSWFVKYVWNPLTAVCNILGVWISGWDIWNAFH